MFSVRLFSFHYITLFSVHQFWEGGINAENQNQYSIGYESEFTKEQSMIEMMGDFWLVENFEFDIYEWTDPQDCLIKKKSE